MKQRESYENQYIRLCMEANQEVNPDVFAMEDVELIGAINLLLEKMGCIPFGIEDKSLFLN